MTNEVHRHEKIFETRKEYDQHQKLELNLPEMKRMDNIELEASIQSSWESPGKDMKEKEYRDFTSIKWYLIEIYESSKQRKGGRAGKTKASWDGYSKHRWEELILDLADVEMFGSTWRETRRLKRIDKTISMIKKD